MYNSLQGMQRCCNVMDMNFLFYLLYHINLIKLLKLEITFIILQKYHAFLQTIQTTIEKKILLCILQL